MINDLRRDFREIVKVKIRLTVTVWVTIRGKVNIKMLIKHSTLNG